METGGFLKTVLRAARDLLRPNILFHAIWPSMRKQKQNELRNEQGVAV